MMICQVTNFLNSWNIYFFNNFNVQLFFKYFNVIYLCVLFVLKFDQIQFYIQNKILKLKELLKCNSFKK